MSCKDKEHPHGHGHDGTVLPADKEMFCYFEGQTYSKGAILNTAGGRIVCRVDEGKLPYWKEEA